MLIHLPRLLTETVSAGDVLMLQELCGFPAAFSQLDELGWYPLHRAAVQPLPAVLEMVLYGERWVQTSPMLVVSLHETLDGSTNRLFIRLLSAECCNV